MCVGSCVNVGVNGCLSVLATGLQPIEGVLHLLPHDRWTGSSHFATQNYIKRRKLMDD